MQTLLCTRNLDTLRHTVIKSFLTELLIGYYFPFSIKVCESNRLYFFSCFNFDDHISSFAVALAPPLLACMCSFLGVASKGLWTYSRSTTYMDILIAN